MSSENLEETYSRRFEDVLVPVAERLEADLKRQLNGFSHIDRICARAKSVDRFLEKAQKQKAPGIPKYSHPLIQIQDQIGARVIVFYKSDVDTIRNALCDYYNPIEDNEHIIECPWQFGYEGKHFVFLIPPRVKKRFRVEEPEFFELQVVTLFQHAWAEANHDLVYKAAGKLTYDQERRCAFAAAQAWGADQIFEELANPKVKELVN